MTSREPDRAPVAAAVVSTGRRPSIVWLIPLVAAIVGGFVAWRTYSELGPLIEIDFETAEGLEAGKTRLKYKDVDVGVVEEIHLQPDLSGVVCTARMVNGAEEWLTEKTRFWVVRPRVAGGQVSGLGTLFSGAYIGVDPIREGERARRFQGLEVPPVVTAGTPGKRFRLRSHRAGSVDVGTPVFFRKIRVGQVLSSELDASGDFVDVQIFVHAPNDERVRRDTRFWNASGVHASMDATGFELDVESLVSLLIGGIAFDARGDETSTLAEEDAVFELYPSREASEREVYHVHTYFQLYFDQSVRGLHVGAPVEFRGIQIGEVRDIKLELDPETQQFRIPVLIAIEPERIANTGGLDPAARREGLQRLVHGGLRAQLESGSLLTGQLLVQLDMHEGVSPAEIVWSEPYPNFPTIPTPLEEITSSVTRLVKRLEKVPLDKIGASVDATLETARATLAQAERTLAQAGSMVGPDSPFNTELRQALVELTDAARSIGLAADQIERQPNSLIFGKQGAVMMRPVASALGQGLLAVALATGCLGGGVPPEYFTLSPAAGSAGGSGGALAARPELGLAVGPVELPRYLDRPEIVTRDGAHRLVLWGEHRWGGSLRTDILRVMTDDLGTLLGTTRIAVFPVEPRFPVDYRVLLELLEFEGVPGGSVTLRARWTVAGPDGRALAIEEARFEEAAASPAWQDLVAAHSAALGRVTRQIAERIASLSAPQRPAPSAGPRSG